MTQNPRQITTPQQKVTGTQAGTTSTVQDGEEDKYKKQKSSARMGAIETEPEITPVKTKGTSNATGLSLLDDESPIATKNDHSSGYDTDSCSDDAGDDGAVENAIELAKTWKIELEKGADKLKCLRFRNSKWLSVLCMIDPEIVGSEEDLK